MSRPAKYSVDQILDAAVDLVAERGPAAVTVAAIAKRLGAPSGSIYHRFKSRDLILANVWLRAAKRSQTGFLEALRSNRPDAPVYAALHVVRWARGNLPEARVLALYRRHDLAERWPVELGDQLEGLNDAIEHELRELARRAYGQATHGTMAAITFAMIDIPYAAMRRYLVAGVAPPATVDPLVEKTVRHALDL
jgi:AcrR family transcriptional regulator